MKLARALTVVSALVLVACVMGLALTVRQPYSADGRTGLAALALAIGAIIAYCTLPINPNAGGNEGAFAAGPPIGDWAGEHLIMARGRYTATLYVGIAFFGQIILLTQGIMAATTASAHGRITADHQVALATACALGTTLCIFWDRWKCTANFSSTYCSGCLNVSVLYVPVIACIYANWRGFMKLSGK